MDLTLLLLINEINSNACGHLDIVDIEQYLIYILILCLQDTQKALFIRKIRESIAQS